MKIPKEITPILQTGGIGVLPTDTLYGLVGQALKKKTVERIYKVRKRNPKKPLIILISRIDDLSLFGISLKKKEKKSLQKMWQKPVSVILPCDKKKFSYLHRGTESLAFRLPHLPWLKNVIKKTGPLVAPSANIEGMDPAETIGEAVKYFRKKVDFYGDNGILKGRSSTIVRLVNGKIFIERKGVASEHFIRKAFE